jgi:hypothetical protein
MLVIDITLSPLNRELYNVLVGTDRTQVRETITKHTVKIEKRTKVQVVTKQNRWGIRKQQNENILGVNIIYQMIM